MSITECLSLFVIAFFSATLLPGGSEAYFIFLLQQNPSHNWIILLITASIANTLGGMSNYFIGYFIHKSYFQDKKKSIWQQLFGKFKFYRTLQQQLMSSSLSPMQSRAQKWVKNWKYPALCFSWLPLIGDLLCVFAGLYQMNSKKVLWYIFIGKSFRYTFVLYLLSAK